VYAPTRLPHDAYASLRSADFRRLLASYAASTVAREAQIVVVGWQIFARTNDPLTLGLIGLSEALPFIAVALYAGHLADRVRRRTMALAGTSGMLLSGIALWLYTIADVRSVWPVYLVIFLSGIARSFTRPAVTALSAEVVEREIYPNAVAWRSSTWQFAAILGPALGGVAYGLVGPAGAYVGVTVLMIAATVPLMLVTHRIAPVADRSIPVRESLKVGVRFILDDPVMLGAMTLDLFAVLFGGAVALLPAFAKLLQVGPQGLGMLRAAPAAGSILTGIWVAHRPPFKRAGVVLFGVVAAFGVLMIAFALSRNFWLSFAILLVSGMFDNVSVIIRGTLLQVRTPPQLLGRVSSVNQIFIGASNEIGAFESGVAARLLGIVPSVVVGGVMTLVVVAVIAARFPALRRLRDASGAVV
jgi:MFS family permease